MPSITETFGLVYAEAMSQGLPVIYSKGQGFDQQFDNGQVGYAVNCFDINEISCRIQDILSNYNSISSNCLKNVSKFNWKKIIGDYVILYSKARKDN